MQHQTLTEFKTLLAAKEIELTESLEQIKSASQPVTLDQQSVGRVSRIDAIQQQQMAVANQLQLQHLLQQVDAALLRIDQESFGLCLHCDEPISTLRLQAQPYAELCIECQEKSEST
ncbi:MAG: DnaK suppressor protein [Gammaproteobacteria bacterium]|jgi:DnaK suppressor protein